jgi:hypothetical protein
LLLLETLSSSKTIRQVITIIQALFETSYLVINNSL